ALIAALDDDQPAARSRAFDRLRDLGLGAETELNQAVQAASAEVRHKAEMLLERVSRPRLRRAVRVLEHINTKEARALPEGIAGATADVSLKQDPRAALQRLHGKPVLQMTPAVEPEPSLPETVEHARPAVLPNPLLAGHDSLGDPLPVG